jgi:hypothetical protein
MSLKGLATAYDDFTQIDTAKRMALGTYVFTGDKTYVYVQGVTSGAAGKHVTFTSAGVTTLTVAAANGPVGILMSTLDATTEYGFIQVFGINATADVTAATAGVAMYLTATAGRLDESDVAADMVLNYTVIVTGSANVATVFLNYPQVIDVAID